MRPLYAAKQTIRIRNSATGKDWATFVPLWGNECGPILRELGERCGEGRRGGEHEAMIAGD